MKKITLAEVEYIAFDLAKKFLSFNEPIPEFSSRFSNVLESCLITPFGRFGGRDAYHGLVAKASVLFYLLIKNHPFQNGNKRLAITILFVFLYKNDKWLKVDNRELYNFAVWAAESPAKLKSETIKAVEKFLNLYIVKL